MSEGLTLLARLHAEAFPLRLPLMAASGDDVTRAIVRLQQTGKLPSSLTQGTVDAMKKSLRKYFDKISADKIDEFADAARKAVEATLHTEQEVRQNQAMTTTVGTGTGEASSQVTAFLEEATGANVATKFNMDFFQRIAREVALGAGKQVAMNLDQTRVDEYPALELLRVYDREIPRGEKRVKGVVVPDPENSWAERWQAACDESGDTAAADCFDSTSRMVALKSSGVWAALGDGAGGYEDTLGNSFAPFAFQSGMDTDEVSREDAVALGLMEDGDEAQGADLDFDELIALPTEAKMYAASVRHRALHAKSDCMARCPACRTIANISKQPEISMGAVACEKCGESVTQADLMENNPRELTVSEGIILLRALQAELEGVA